jgi:hypothetical protein
MLEASSFASVAKEVFRKAYNAIDKKRRKFEETENKGNGEEGEDEDVG